MDSIDRAVLETLAGDVLRPEVVSAVIEGVLDAMRPDRQHHSEAAIASELVVVDREVARLTEAVASGGDIPTLVAALQSRQARRSELLAARGPIKHPGSTNRKVLETTIRARLEDWRGLLTRNVQDARKLLREVLSGPLRFTPENGMYRFEGEAAIGRLLGAAGVATFVASPTEKSDMYGKLKGRFARVA